MQANSPDLTEIFPGYHYSFQIKKIRLLLYENTLVFWYATPCDMYIYIQTCSNEGIKML